MATQQCAHGQRCRPLCITGEAKHTTMRDIRTWSCDGMMWVRQIAAARRCGALPSVAPMAKSATDCAEVLPLKWAFSLSSTLPWSSSGSSFAFAEPLPMSRRGREEAPPASTIVLSKRFVTSLLRNFRGAPKRTQTCTRRAHDKLDRSSHRQPLSAASKFLSRESQCLLSVLLKAEAAPARVAAERPAHDARALGTARPLPAVALRAW